MKLQLGMIVTDARGKAGGQYIKKFGSLHVLGNITKPTYRLAGQQNKQIAFNAYLFSQWDRLDSAVRAEWDIVGSNIISKNVFGIDKALSGRQAFLRYSMILFAMNLDVASPYVFDYTVPLLSVSGVDIRKTSLELDVNLTTISGASYFQYSIVRIRSSSVTKSASKMKIFFASVILPSSSELYTAFDEFVGGVTTGDWYQIGMRTINSSGVTSLWQVHKAVVSPT